MYVLVPKKRVQNSTDGVRFLEKFIPLSLCGFVFFFFAFFSSHNRRCGSRPRLYVAYVLVWRVAPQPATRGPPDDVVGATSVVPKSSVSVARAVPSERSEPEPWPKRSVVPKLR